jgi:hypothetical protein
MLDDKPTLAIPREFTKMLFGDRIVATSHGARTAV